VNSTTPMLVSSRASAIVEFKNGFGTEGVAFVRRLMDFDTVGFVVEDVFVGFGGLPVDLWAGLRSLFQFEHFFQSANRQIRQSNSSLGGTDII